MPGKQHLGQVSTGSCAIPLNDCLDFKNTYSSIRGQGCPLLAPLLFHYARACVSVNGLNRLVELRDYRRLSSALNETAARFDLGSHASCIEVTFLLVTNEVIQLDCVQVDLMGRFVMQGYMGHVS